MVNFITAEKARKNAEMCRNVVAKDPLGDVGAKRLFVSEDISGKTLEDIVSDEIFKEISKKSYCGKYRAKKSRAMAKEARHSSAFSGLPWGIWVSMAYSPGAPGMDLAIRNCSRPSRNKSPRK